MPAITEELILYAEGSVAFNEFPGGAQRVAKQMLRPKLVFYELETTLPDFPRPARTIQF